jgi:hypothetical protein
VNPRNCKPEVRTLNYLKKNLLYCFEPQTRSQLKEQMQNLEETFFLSSTTQQTLDARTKTEETATSARERKRGASSRKDEGAEGDITIERADKPSARRVSRRGESADGGRKQRIVDVE